jgi:hypothetical protein
MLAKIVKLATACREANSNMDTTNIRDNSSSSREASNIQQVRQQQQQEIKTIVEYWQQPCWQQQRQLKHYSQKKGNPQRRNDGSSETPTAVYTRVSGEHLGHTI